MRVFSGIQPTGCIHLGNYLGAVRSWGAFPDAMYAIVNMHAITIPHSPQQLRIHTRDMAATLLACGVPESRIFLQSDVHAHTVLSWILSCSNVAMHQLNTMTQFKSKSNKHGSSLGLYSYPALMAADVLLYKATHVPVGHDQTQHMQLMRDVAASFNRKYEVDYFPVPEAIVTKATRVKSLRDASVKMSKSDASGMSRIELMDTPEDILLKLRKAKTDSIGGISYDVAARPEVANLVEIYAELADLTVDQVVDQFSGSDSLTFKQNLADLCVQTLSPIRTEILRLQKEPAYLRSVLDNGRDMAQESANETIEEVKEIVGFGI